MKILSPLHLQVIQTIQLILVLQVCQILLQQEGTVQVKSKFLYFSLLVIVIISLNFLEPKL